MKNKSLERLKYYFSVCCISFTLVELFLSCLNIMFDLMSSNLWINNIEMFAVCLCISFLMFLTDYKTGVFEMQGNIGIINMLIHLIDVSVPVLVLGGLVFHWFNVFSLEVFVPLSVLIVVYFATYGIIYLNGIIITKNINRKIMERKGEQKNDRQNHSGQ